LLECEQLLSSSRSNQRDLWPARHRPGTKHSPRVARLVPGPDELSCSTAGLTPGPSQLVQAVPDRHNHLWQRIWDILRLIQPGAPLESNMQRDMQCDVTCCTVTSASLRGILCLASGRSEDTRFTDKSMEQHQLLIQRSEGRFTPLALSAAPTSREEPGTMRRPSWSAH